jgi:uncharacterized lipoprotein
MKTPIIKTVFLGLAILLSQFGCSSTQVESENIYYTSKIFTKEYDEVWKALEEIMVDELMYPIKTKDKKKGVIQTDWITVIRIRGTLRWYLKALLYKKDNGTLVKIYNRVEEPSEIKEKFKDKKGEFKTGWMTSEEKMADVGIILEMLRDRFE